MSKGSSSNKGDNVRVVCRVRPHNEIEQSRGGKNCVSTSETGVSAKSPDGSLEANFDRVFGPDSTQPEVYEYAGRPIVADIFKGYNGTIFAYGQTSSGKTHTMMGPSLTENASCGIIPRVVRTIFQTVMEADEHMEFTVQFSMLEIYMERIKDLLDPSKTNLPVREDSKRGIFVDGITEEFVASEEEMMEMMRVGSENRAMSATGMNRGSSRSHSVVIVTIGQKDLRTGTHKFGKLFLVDLAGSEMVRKTGAAGQQLEEAKTINKSLSALGQVINALTDGRSSHIPYRDSKLTRVLQESLGGNTRTVLIVCCSPSSYNVAETVSTLRFGQRAKRITNAAHVNEEKSAEELKQQLKRAEHAIDVQQTCIKQLQDALQTVTAQLEQAREQGFVPSGDQPAPGAVSEAAQATEGAGEGEQEGEEPASAGGEEGGGNTAPGTEGVAEEAAAPATSSDDARHRSGSSASSASAARPRAPSAAELGVGVADPLRVAELEASLEEAREEGARNAGSLRDAEAEVKSLTEQLQAKEEEADRVAATAEKQRRKADALRLILAAQVRETTRFMLEASAAAAEREDPSSAELREGLDHLMGVTGSAQKEAARVFEEHVRRHSGGEGEGEGEDDLDDEEDGKDPRWASPSVQEALRVERGLHDVARALHEAQSKLALNLRDRSSVHAALKEDRERLFALLTESEEDAQSISTAKSGATVSTQQGPGSVGAACASVPATPQSSEEQGLRAREMAAAEEEARAFAADRMRAMEEEEEEEKAGLGTEGRDAASPPQPAGGLTALSETGAGDAEVAPSSSMAGSSGGQAERARPEWSDEDTSSAGDTGSEGHDAEDAPEGGREEREEEREEEEEEVGEEETGQEEEEEERREEIAESLRKRVEEVTGEALEDEEDAMAVASALPEAAEVGDLDEKGLALACTRMMALLRLRSEDLHWQLRKRSADLANAKKSLRSTDRLRTRTKELERKVAVADADRKALQEKAQGLRHSLASEHATAEGLHNSLKNRVDRVVQLQEEVHSLREALERSRAAAPQGSAESSGPADDPRLAVLIKQHKETLRRVSVLQKERAELIKERSTLSQQVVEKESRVRSLESDLQSKERTYVDKIKRDGKTRERLMAKLQEVLADRDRLMEEAERYRNQLLRHMQHVHHGGPPGAGDQPHSKIVRPLRGGGGKPSATGRLAGDAPAVSSPASGTPPRAGVMGALRAGATALRSASPSPARPRFASETASENNSPSVWSRAFSGLFSSPQH